MNEVLVDTSAWIEYFRPRGDKRLHRAIIALLDQDLVATTGIIKAELLKGARSAAELEQLKQKIASLMFLETPEILWEACGELGFECLKRGYTIPTADLLIAAIAIRYDCALLHCDQHFDHIARCSTLRLFSAGIKKA